MTAAVDRAAAVAARFHARWLTLIGAEPGNPSGVEVRWFADDLVATKAIAEPELRWVQHVAGFGAGHVGMVDDILDWYGGIPCRFETRDSTAVSALLDRGGVDGGPIDLLVGRPVARRAETGLAIEEVTPSRADAFAAVLLVGHEVADAAPAHHGALARFVGSPGVTCWIASDDETVIGGAVLVVDDGVAYLANASTTPAGRRRGIQTSLIETRIVAAVDAGCDVVASLANPGGSSHRNLTRAGLEPAEHRTMLHAG